jgi:alkylated DNA nucleotide flippase Atl1
MSSSKVKKKNWREKLADDKDLPKVCPIDATKGKRWGEGTFVIPAPREVDAIMKRVPRGKLLTIDEIRRLLAQKHQTTITCPLTTGIFAWIAAHAAEEGTQHGEKNTTPYWRTLKAKGELNPKYPGGVEKLRQLLESEGHTVVQRGKRFFVLNYADALAVPAGS